jgi:hypothetical protein
MPYFPKSQYKFVGFRKSKTKGKMYDAKLKSRTTGKIKHVAFGSSSYQNYRDVTGLNLYPRLIHGDKERRRRYHVRHKHYVKVGYYSAGYFAMKYLW